MHSNAWKDAKGDLMRSMAFSFMIGEDWAYINFEVHAGSALHVDDVGSQVSEEGLQVGGGVPASNIAIWLDLNQVEWNHERPLNHFWQEVISHHDGIFTSDWDDGR